MKDIRQITIMTWSCIYDVRSDGHTLTDSSSKMFVENLMVYVKDGLEKGHRRTGSSSSSKGAQAPPLGSSTPKRGEEMIRTNSELEDMR